MLETSLKYDHLALGQSWNSAAPAPHAKVDQELHHMKNPSYSNLWWHSFWKEEVAIHISKWSTSLSVSQRDGRSKNEIEQKKTDEISIKRETEMALL